MNPDPLHHPLPQDPDFWRELIAGNEYWFEVTSDSMVPTLRAGDRVRVGSLARPPVGGEVVVFLHEGRLVVHRCLGGGRFRGDGRLLPDPPVPPGQIVGLALSCRRAGGEWLLGNRLPWRTRWHRLGLRCRRLDRWLRRFFVRLLRGQGAEGEV